MVNNIIIKVCVNHDSAAWNSESEKTHTHTKLQNNTIAIFLSPRLLLNFLQHPLKHNIHLLQYKVHHLTCDSKKKSTVYSATSIIQTSQRPKNTLTCMCRRRDWWSFVGVVTDWAMSYGQNWLTKVLCWTLLAMIILYTILNLVQCMEKKFFQFWTSMFNITIMR